MSGGEGTGVDETVGAGRTQPGSGRDRDGYGDRGGVSGGRQCEGEDGGEEGVFRVVENQDVHWDIKDA